MRSRIASLVWSALNFCHSASLEWATMQVDVHRAMATWRRHEALLGRGDHGVQVLGLVLEDLDELHHAAVADVERAV